MASDLSNLIQEGICSTLNGLLAKDASIKETTKSVEQDFLNKQHLKVESTFEFDNITSTWNFIIPAYTSSLVFNSMLGDDSEPVNEIDADIADAISEFISNLSGSLTTAINGAGFEDLGQSKFTIGTNEILDSIENIDNTFGFDINLEGKDIKLYIQFDEIILPFLEVIKGSSESKHEAPSEPIVEEEPQEEEESLVKVEDEPKNEEQTSKEAAFLDQETPKEEEPKKEPSENKESKDEEINDDEEIEETEESKKSKKLKLIIFIVAGLLITTIIAGIVMYFMGAFDPEPIPVQDTNNTKMVKKVGDVEVIQYKSKKKTDFNPDDINENRLNSRLAALSKYEVMSEEQIQEQALAEKDRLYRLQKEEELIKFAQKNKEENIFTETNESKEKEMKKESKNMNTQMMDMNSKMKENEETIPTKKELEQELIDTAKTQIQNNQEQNIIDPNNLRFVIVGSLKFKLYKELISKMDTNQARISICKNEKGRTAVYMGPFNNETTQTKMLTMLHDENIMEAKLANITQEEFDIRCNFE